jgi:hypothetical protein
MSKPITRISLAILISLALVAAIYVTVLGASQGAGASGVQAHVVNGLQTNLNHDRSATSDTESSYPQTNTLQKDGSCHSEAQTNPSDY